jgi:hypothetical protein
MHTHGGLYLLGAGQARGRVGAGGRKEGQQGNERHEQGHRQTDSL